MPGRPSGVWHIVQPPTHAATGVRFHMHCPMPDTEHTHFPGSAPSPQPDDEIHIGLMSGTSMDGVDGVMLAFAPEGHIRTTLGHAFLPMPEALRQQLTALQHPAHDELRSAALASQTLADLYAGCVSALLQQAGLPAGRIRALGAHGQTVRHAPAENWSLQLLDAPRLAERTGIDVVADLRSADIAAGGHGAPLMPAFHAHLFADHPGRFGILNLGGIANLTVIDSSPTATNTSPPAPPGVGISSNTGAGTSPAVHISGYDTGPANTLLDGWIEHHQGKRYDHQGQWAASGRIIPSLLHALMAEPYFGLRPPKSTGRDLFNLPWLQQHLQQHQQRHGQASPEDVQATLLALTAETTAAAIRAARPSAVYVCGGGAENPVLMQAIQQAVGPNTRVQSTAALGIAPQAVEASGFAWLARQHVHRIPIDLPPITGARHPSLLGALHLASR